MIIKTLEFCNFLRFFGTSTMDLSVSQAKDSSLALVLAPNDAGKTSLVRSLEFLFYGTVEGKHGDTTIAALVNNEAVRVAEESSIRGYVQATLVSHGSELTVRRSVSIACDATGDRSLRRVTLSSLEREKWKSDQDDVLAYKLERLMPKSLFQYFVFQGEGLAEMLIEKQDPRIREGLTELLHESDWQEAIDDLRSVQTALNSDCRRASGKNHDLEVAVDRLAMAEEREAKQKRELAAAEEQLQLALAEVDRWTGLVAESVGQVDEEAAKRLVDVRQRHADRKRRLGAAESGLSAAIGATRGLPFLKKAFEPVREILEDLRAQHLLPADVSEGFVGRILKRGVCMCGCELTQGSEPRKRVEHFRASSLSAELNTDLFQLYNMLEPGSARGFEAQIEQSLRILQDSSEFIADESRGIAKLEEELRVLQARVDEEAQKRCHDLLRQQRKAMEHHAALSARVRELRMQLDAATKHKDLAAKELRSLRGRIQTAGSETMFEMRDLTGQLVELLEAGLSGLKESLHEPLEESIRKMYVPAVKDGSDVAVSPRTLLPRIKKGGRDATFLGGGQKQVLCLAYIIALAQLRKRLHDTLRTAGIMVPAADDQAFVMDSIFGQCEPEYQEAICRFLPGQAGQIILLLAGQQWSETVRRSLEKDVDQLFGFQYHSPNLRYDERKHRFSFLRSEHRLLKQVPNGTTAYTTIEALAK